MFDPSNYACLPDGDCGSDTAFWLYVAGLIVVICIWSKISEWRNK